MSKQLTVKELIEALQKFPPECPVVIYEGPVVGVCRLEPTEHLPHGVAFIETEY